MNLSPSLSKQKPQNESIIVDCTLLIFHGVLILSLHLSKVLKGTHEERLEVFSLGIRKDEQGGRQSHTKVLRISALMKTL